MPEIQQPAAEAGSVSAPPAPTAFAVVPRVASFNYPLQEFLNTYNDLDGIAVGACVFNPDGKLLLVQRAAHDSMPLRWEVPGGGCTFEDETILHGLARELWEESGLRAKIIGNELGVNDIFCTRRGRRLRKFTFIVEVEGYDVLIDSNEHQAFVWASEEEARAKRCGNVDLVYTDKAQEDAIYKAFEEKKGKI
ncbi:NUDIX hydrolase domain-like protein [Biscogniauxia marginata]|nr:NUDIX hydrolase domain-like protein [Biscogniauxia marginata]